MRRETFKHLQKSLYIRSVLETTYLSENILNNAKAWSYSRCANRYHHYARVQCKHANNYQKFIFTIYKTVVLITNVYICLGRFL